MRSQSGTQSAGEIMKDSFLWFTVEAIRMAHLRSQPRQPASCDRHVRARLSRQGERCDWMLSAQSHNVQTQQDHEATAAVARPETHASCFFASAVNPARSLRPRNV
jgi:hypothetical protein